MQIKLGGPCHTILKRAALMTVLMGLLLAAFTADKASAAKLSVGQQTACYVSEANVLRCWGANMYGQLGLGFYGSGVDAEILDVPSPAVVEGLGGIATDISLGFYHNCAVVSGGAKCWGANMYGQLGTGDQENRTTPAQVLGMTSGVTKISSGYYSTCAVKSGGLWCWGVNGNDPSSSAFPALKSGLESGVTDVAVSANDVCVVQNGAMRCWGNLTEWSVPGAFWTPKTIPGMESGVTQVVDACALQNGSVKCLLRTQLIPETPSPSVPFPIEGLESEVSQLSAHGGTFGCVVQASMPKCWGTNYGGWLGRGTADNYPSYFGPGAVVGLPSGIAEISAGGNTACALSSADAVYCWGQNHYGGLGNGSHEASYLPVPTVPGNPGSEDPDPTDPPSAPACKKKVAFIGVRGSGENDSRLLGSPVGYMADDLAALMTDEYGDTVTDIYSDEGLPYDAIPVDLLNPNYHVQAYNQSVRSGESSLSDTLEQAYAECPKQKYVIAGYSQGAEAIGNTLSNGPNTARGVPVKIRKKIITVVMFADPRWNFEDRKLIHMGNFSDHNNANWNGEAYSGIRGPRKAGTIRGAKTEYPLYTFCRYQDPVCQGLLNGQHHSGDAWYENSVQHGKYNTAEDAGLAAKIAFQRIRASIK